MSFIPKTQLIMLLVFTVSVAPLHCAETPNAFASFQAAINKETAVLNPASSDQRDTLARAQVAATAVDQALAQGELGNSLNVLDQLAALPDLSPALKASAQQLHDDLPGLISQREADYVARVDAAFKKTGDACLSAKKENDLASVQTALSALGQERLAARTSPAAQRANGKLQAALSFVPQWQDYLTQSAAGNSASAHHVLGVLLNSDDAYPVLPRAQIEARLAALSSTAKADAPALDILRKIKRLDDLGTTLDKLKQLPPTGSGGSSVSELEPLNNAYLAFRQGLYGQAYQAAIQQAPNLNAPWSQEIIRVRNLVLRVILPRYLDLPNSSTPRADENPSQFLERLCQESVSKGGWGDLPRLLEAYRDVAFQGGQIPSWIKQDLAGCGAFAAGLNQEKAKQFPLAVRSYQSVLRTNGKYSPVSQATEHLAALERKQPELFKQGVGPAFPQPFPMPTVVPSPSATP